MKRPMVIVAAIYLGGIVLGEISGPASAGRLTAWLVGVVICAVTALFRVSVRRWLLALGLVLAGAASLDLSQAVLSPHDLRRLAPAEPALASVRGRLRETPVERLYTRHDEVTQRTQAELALSAVRWKNGPWQAAFGTVAVSSAGVLDPVYFGGRAVEIDGVLRRPAGPTAPGGFDDAAYLRRRGVHYQLHCAGAEDWRLSDSDPGDAATARPLADRFAAWARATLARGLPAEDQPLQLLWAMTLGWRTALTGEVSEIFMRSGTMHVFAISGLHVALIAGLLLTILRVGGLPRRWCALVIIPLIWMYAGATGWQASAVRSTVMMSVIAAGWLLARPSDLINSLAAAGFLILVWDPQQLFQAGFQLSFAVVLSLALLVPALDRLRLRLFQYDPWIPDDLRPRWQRWLRRPLDYVTTNLAVAVAAWLGSLPLVAAYFNLVTPVSLLANLIVVPLSSGALACSLGSLMIGPVIPFAGELFNHSAWFFMLLMIRVSDWAARLPGGCLNVASPGPLVVLTYYAALAGWLAGIVQRRRLRWWFGGGLALAAAIACAQHVREQSPIRLTVLPMNGGGAVHLASPARGRTWLIDCGDDASAAFVLKPYLRSQGLNRIENLLLTHGDVHHAGGVPVLEKSFPIERAWLSAVPFRSSIYRAARERLAVRPGVVQTLRRGQTIPPWTVLHPEDGDRLPQADDNAVVLLGNLGGVRVLLLSDLGKPGQNLLLTRQPDLRADVVISGIPARTEPLADALIETVGPRLIVVADAEYPATQRASRALRERLESHHIPVMYTRETGALVLTLADGSWTLKPTRSPSR